MSITNIPDNGFFKLKTKKNFFFKDEIVLDPSYFLSALFYLKKNIINDLKKKLIDNKDDENITKFFKYLDDFKKEIESFIKYPGRKNTLKLKSALKQYKVCLSNVCYNDSYKKKINTLLSDNNYIAILNYIEKLNKYPNISRISGYLDDIQNFKFEESLRKSKFLKNQIIKFAQINNSFVKLSGGICSGIAKKGVYDILISNSFLGYSLTGDLSKFPEDLMVENELALIERC